MTKTDGLLEEICVVFNKSHRKTHVHMYGNEGAKGEKLNSRNFQFVGRYMIPPRFRNTPPLPMCVTGGAETIKRRGLIYDAAVAKIFQLYSHVF